MQLEEEIRRSPQYQYVSYRDLDLLTKKYKYELQQVTENAVPDEGQLDELHNTFFFRLRDNLVRVDKSFNEGLKACQTRLDTLKKERSYKTFAKDVESNGPVEISSDYKALYMELLDLNKMRKVNREAFRKIVKKFDKVAEEENQDTFMKNEVDICIFAQNDALKEIEENLMKAVQKHLGLDRSPEASDAFRLFREATLAEHQQKTKKKGVRRFDITSYRTYIAYALSFAFLYLFLSVGVQPRFLPDATRNWEGYVVIFGIIFGVLLIAVHNKPADVCLMSVNIFFLTIGIINAKEAFAGFSNAGVIANGILLPFARALSLAGGAELCLMACLGKPSTEPFAMVRMCVVVGTLSSVLNNTPIVFMMIPILQVWCSRLNMSVSKFMMPMSFAIMLGGTCSIVGSSANLVTIGIASTYYGNFAKGTQPEYVKPGFWSPAVIGLPVAIVGILWMILTSKALLPKRIPAPGDKEPTIGMGPGNRTTSLGSLRQATSIATPAVFSSMARFNITMKFSGTMIGSTVEETGITRLGAQAPKVVHIYNIDEIHSKHMHYEEEPFDGPWQYRIKEGDVVVFQCSSQQVNIVRQCQGLEVFNKYVEKVEGERREKTLVEVTVGERSFIAGKSLVELDMRRKYNVACLAVWQKPKPGARRLEAQRDDFKQVTLKEGDVMLLEVVKKPTLSMFARQKWFSSMVVVENSAPPMRDTRNMVLTMGSLLLLVILTSLEIIDIVALGFIVVSSFIWLKVITPKEAWASLKGDVLLTIAASFGIGQAMSNSGVAMWVGNMITAACAGSEIWVLTLVYAFTVTLGMFLNNASVAVLVYPVAYAACVENAGLDPELVVLLIIMGAGLSFTTPMSYQTNQMVQGPGGYKFGDYVLFGGCLQIASGVASVAFLYLLANAGYVRHHHAQWVPQA